MSAADDSIRMCLCGRTNPFGSVLPRVSPTRGRSFSMVQAIQSSSELRALTGCASVFRGMSSLMSPTTLHVDMHISSMGGSNRLLRMSSGLNAQARLIDTRASFTRQPKGISAEGFFRVGLPNLRAVERSSRPGSRPSSCSLCITRLSVESVTGLPRQA